MGRLQGFGGHVESVLRTRRGIAHMTAADYQQPKCQECGGPINDDRIRGVKGGGETRFCSGLCGTKASQRRRGVIGRPTRYRWDAVYQQARNAQGAWVEVPFNSKQQAQALERSVGNKRGYEASRNELIVSVRFMGAV